MTLFFIRTLQPEDGPALEALQQEYARVYSGAPVVPGGLYLSPAFHNGEDVLCAFADESDAGRPAGGALLAYAPLYFQVVEDGPPELPHAAWVEVKAHPRAAEPLAAKELLLEKLLARARVLAAEHPGRDVRVTFEYRANEAPAVTFVMEHGFAYTESVFYMERDLAEAPIPDAPPPQGITLQRWKMQSEAEQRAYVMLHNRCFPEAPITLAGWQYVLQSPPFAAGRVIGAFAGEELTGAASAYWIEEENQGAERPAGMTEDIFVAPGWRGQGIASALIAEAMRHLKEHGIAAARLAVRAQNENALALYRSLGYQVGNESRFYAKKLD